MDSFEQSALQLWRHQAQHNFIYRDYLAYLGTDLDAVRTLAEVPFLPISFFKHHTLQTGTWEPEQVFTSSGTTGMTTSRHFIKDTAAYLENARRCFEYFFGKLSDYHILALLPAYLERQQSSLVAMVDYFIKLSQSPFSGFYLHDTEKLLKDIARLRHDQKKVMLWGVTFALLDLAEQYQPDLSHCLVFETGGMKGRRKEITRAELHTVLQKSFHTDRIYSEYGMTEMLSQAYSMGEHKFFCPPSLKVIAREVTDPFTIGIQGIGALNVVDLANIHSVAFLETEDLGAVGLDGSFQVMGRLDNSDVRGCNLLLA